MARKNNTAVAQTVVETVVETPVVENAAPVMPTIAELEADGHITKSAKIRALGAAGFKAGPISKHLGVIYQHAYNVLNKPLKRVEAETPATSAAEVQEGETEASNTQEA